MSLVGVGGLGKTQLALEYCYRDIEDTFQFIIWIDASSQETFERSLDNVASDERLIYRMGMSHMNLNVTKMLSELSEPWLLVLDGLNSKVMTIIQDEKYRSILRCENCSILATCRKEEVQGLGTTITMPHMTEEESIGLLKNSSRDTLSAPDDLIKIARLLDGIPLALSQAAAYVRKKHISFAEYLERYKDTQGELLAEAPQIFQYREIAGREKQVLASYTTATMSSMILRGSVRTRISKACSVQSRASSILTSVIRQQQAF